MLLILLFVGLTVIGIILEVLYKKVWKDWYSITFEILPAFLIGMGCLALICCTPIIVVEKTCNERHRLEWQTERDNLLARCSYDIPDDMLGVARDNGILFLSCHNQIPLTIFLSPAVSSKPNITFAD